ncbi:DUF748 domain-containing protein [Pseudodesulfovibrio pelocollis]|uniref:DUF748 domain-containing protein n=1 Tax=Pseudodesulfovibrio pelocollis TaxID=3051432 RepID=UPI00255AD61C|nr:DUF748 domain-containing protein [Pseudodesulfovibrio sp. SB368]
MMAFLDKIPLATPRIRRVAFGLLCGLVAYALAGFLLLPTIIKSTIVGQGAAALGRSTHLGEAAFNPFTLRLTLRDFRVDARTDGTENAEALLSFDELSASASISSLWKMAPVINDLALGGLAVSVTHYGDGHYSISDLLDGPGGPDESPDQVGTPFPFALYGFEMSNATIVFDDRPHGKRHVISEINLSVPFTSSFEALRGEFTQPTCSAVINGDPITLDGQTLPFHDSLRTEFRLGAVNVDLSKYWPYVQADTPLSLTRGRFSSDISLNFERPDARRITVFISGGGSLTGLEIASPDDGTVLSAERLGFRLERFSPGDMRLALSELSVDKPVARVIRHEDGQLNWERYFPASGDGNGNAATADEAIQAVIRALTVNSGRVEWIDRAVPGGFTRAVTDMTITAQGVNTGAEPAPFAASLTIGPLAEGNATADGRATITANGRFALSPLSASAAVTAAGIALPDYAPYFAQALPLTVDSGVVGLSGTVALADSATITLRDGTMALTDLQLRAPDSDTPVVTASRLDVDGIALDTGTRVVTVAEIRLEDPEARLRMDEPGRVDLVTMFEDRDDLPDSDVAAEDDLDWTVEVNVLRLHRGSVTLVDASAVPASGVDASAPHASGPPAALALTGIGLEVRDISTRRDGSADAPESTPLTGDLTADWGGGGTIGITAKATLAPLTASGTVTLAGVGLLPANPYLSRFADMALTRGAASSTMDFELAEDGRLTLSGNASVTDTSVIDTAVAQTTETGGQGAELVGFDTLGLTSFRFESEPARLAVEAIRLTGPRGQVEFDEKGHVNLLTALRIAQPDPLPDSENSTGLATVAASQAVPEAANADASPEPAEPGFFETMRIGTVIMDNGLIRFRDASVTPAYATEVKDIRLTLTDIAQTDEARPKVDMHASLGHTPLSAKGVINPVVVPLYSDITVNLGGLELAPLTPYTLKYLGYPVEGGRLYAEVVFRTENNVLDADNAFHIRQLALGPRDTRPDAPNVQVRFGLSLLEDANGDVRINLPIRGRLDDPNFRLNGIVFKALAGLFTRALTSPFSIIGSLFGGAGKDIDTLVFEPGRSDLRASALHKLDTVAAALDARPRLTLEVVGVTDPEADRQGLVDIHIQHRLKERKLRSLPPSQRAWTTVEAMTIEPDEYEDLLYEAYKAEPDETGTRPTTFFVADRQPPEVMRKYLEDAIAVTEDDLRQLERDRAEAVRLHLVERDPALEKRVTLPDRRGVRTARTGVPLHRADLGLR